MAAKDGSKKSGRQLLHLVFGGELASLDKIEFTNLKALDIVGIYPNYAAPGDIRNTGNARGGGSARLDDHTGPCCRSSSRGGSR